MQSLAHGNERSRGSLLGGETSLPLDTGALLPDLEDAGIGAPEGGDGSLSAALVCVLGEGSDLGEGLLDVLLKVGAVARVGDDITENVESNLLLKSDSSNGIEVLKVLDIVPVIITTSGNGDVVLGLRSLDLDTLATNDNSTVTELGGIDARELNLLLLELERGEETLEDTLKEVVKLLVVDLGQVGPEDEAGLLEARVVEVESLLAGLHQVHNVRLEGLRADGHGDTSQAVAGRASEVEGLLTVLDGDEVAEGSHDILEVGLEGRLHGGSDSTNGGGGSSLDTKVLVVKETDHGLDQVGTILSHDLGVDTVAEGVEGTTRAANDANILLVGTSLGGSLEVLEDSADDLVVMGSHLIGHLLSEVDQTDKRGVSDLGLGIAEEVDDGREERLKLSRDEVGGTLGGVTKSEHGSHAELGVLVGSEAGELLEKGNNDLSRRKLAGQSVDEADGGAGRGHILLLIVRVELSDDVHGLDHQLSTHVLHGLDLHAAVANALDEEGQGLGSGVVLGVGVGTKLNHELEQIPEVDGEERGVVGDEGVEDFEDDLVALLILGLDGSLEDVNQARNEALHGLEGLGILLGLDDHEDGTNSADDVDADLLALRVLNAGLEELKELVGVVAEVGRVLLEHGVEEERTDLASNDIVVVVEGQKLSEEVLTLAILHVGADDAGDETGERVADTSRLLLEGALEKVVAGKLSLVLSSLLPVLGD